MTMFHFVLVVIGVINFTCVKSTDGKTLSFEDERGNTVKLKLEVIGCYADSEPRALRTMYFDGRPLINWSDPFNTTDIIERCAENAYKQSFTNMFGVQYYGECWGDGSAEIRYNKYNVSSNCAHGVGRDWANMVYRYQVVEAIPAAGM